MITLQYDTMHKDEKCFSLLQIFQACLGEVVKGVCNKEVTAPLFQRVKGNRELHFYF